MANYRRMACKTSSGFYHMNLSQDFPQQFEGWLHAIREMLTSMVGMMDVYLEENSEVITQQNKVFLLTFMDKPNRSFQPFAK